MRLGGKRIPICFNQMAAADSNKQGPWPIHRCPKPKKKPSWSSKSSLAVAAVAGCGSECHNEIMQMVGNFRGQGLAVDGF